MKKATISIMFAAAILLSGCKTTKVVTDEQRNYISWIAFCATRGYDVNQTDYATTNEYLDSWCGSAEEEEAFIKAGVEPY